MNWIDEIYLYYLNEKFPLKASENNTQQSYKTADGLLIILYLYQSLFSIEQIWHGCEIYTNFDLLNDFYHLLD